jgi:transposase
MKMRTQSFQQMKALIVTAPAELREQLRSLSRDHLVDTAGCLRPGPVTSVAAAVKLTLKCLAQRHQMLTTEMAMLDRDLDRLVLTAAPALCALKGIGTDVAGAVLVAAGDNPERLRSESAFANLCGVAPLPASSGKTTGRHRLNHGGDRHANCALWRVVIVRLATHQPTMNYMARRTQEGMSKAEIIRCLKRYVAREIYRELTPPAALAAAA